uniref:Ovule protein n=1 Tax=Ascaris lumbricoides TaxID=6252 RepID=A0A0M3IP91_ASCLU
MSTTEWILSRYSRSRISLKNSYKHSRSTLLVTHTGLTKSSLIYISTALLPYSSKMAASDKPTQHYRYQLKPISDPLRRRIEPIALPELSLAH